MTPLCMASSRVRYSLIETGSLCDLSLRKKSISIGAPIVVRAGRGQAVPPGARRLVHQALVRVMAGERGVAGAPRRVHQREREEVALRMAAAEGRGAVAH